MRRISGLSSRYVLGAEYHRYNVHFISNWIQVNKEDWYSYLLPHDSSEGEHGHIHGDQDHGDENSDEQDKCGFEHRAHAADCVFEFFGEGFTLPAEHFGQTVRLLSDADERREFSVVEIGESGQCFGEGIAPFEPSLDLVERLAVGVESYDLAEHSDAGEQGHARGA